VHYRLKLGLQEKELVYHYLNSSKLRNHFRKHDNCAVFIVIFIYNTCYVSKFLTTFRLSRKRYVIAGWRLILFRVFIA